MSINYLINQSTNSYFGPDFPLMCRTTSPNQSLYASVGFSLLAHISRLKQTVHISETVQNLTQLFNNIASMVENQAYYIEKIKIFATSLEYAQKYDIPSFLPWFSQSDAEPIALTIRLIAIFVLRKNSHPEAERAMQMDSAPTDDQAILNNLSEALMVTFNFFNSNFPTVIDEGRKTVTPMLFVAKVQNEYVSLSHSSFANLYAPGLSLDTYPFVHVKQPMQEIGKISQIPLLPGIPKLPSENSNKSVTNAYSPFAEFLVQIAVKRQWRFSAIESETLKPILKQLKTSSTYKESAENLQKLLKLNPCEHSYSSFFLFSCGKSHCVKCIGEEIELKKLMKYQVFCACKQKLTDSELDYFFMDGLKNSLQHCPGGREKHEEPKPLQAGHQGNPVPEYKSNQGPALTGNTFPHSGPQGGMNLPPIPSGSIPPNLPFPVGPMKVPEPANIPVPSIPAYPSSNVPSGGTSGLPGVPNIPKMPSSGPSGIPGLPSYIPGGFQGGMPSGVPMSIPIKTPGLPTFPGIPENNSSQGAISLPRVKFCFACNVPINPSDLEVRGNNNYHKGCKSK